MTAKTSKSHLLRDDDLHQCGASTGNDRRGLGTNLSDYTRPARTVVDSDGQAQPAENRIERWRPVVGYEGHYEVSDLGRVRGLKTGRVLKPNTVSRYGHQQVKLCMLGKTRDLLVSRLVLEAFVGPGDGQQARHVNENDASNNALTNLAWGTQSENEEDKKRHGSVVLSMAPHNVARRARKARRKAA